MMFDYYASFLCRHRRALALGAASVLLHVLAFWWVAPQLGRAGANAAAQKNAPITVRLLSAAAPEAPVPPAPPAPIAPRKPVQPVAPVASFKPFKAPEPPPQVQASDEARSGEVTAPQQDSAAASDAGVPGEPPGESAAPAVVATGPDAAPLDPGPPEPAPAAPPPARRYKVNLPPSAQIVLDVERRDADGMLWHGEAAMAWSLQGQRYRLKVSAGIRLLIARISLLTLYSEGTTGDSGFAPTTMTEQRRGRAPTATHFNARDGLITFSASTASFALLPGAQDKATVPLQLAAIARGDSTQLEGDIDILVGEDKDASVYRFIALGQEQLDTGLGKMATWHLSRPPRTGSYGSRLDIWLAPGHGWFPVQIRNSEANGAVTTQTVKQIVMTQAGA